MFPNFWRKSGDRSKSEVETSPSQSFSVDYEAVLFALLDEMERRAEFNRGWIRGFLEQRGVTQEALAEWLRGFGERLQPGEEHQELGERLLRLERLDEGELCRVAGLIGRRLERECRSRVSNDNAQVWFKRGYECHLAEDFEGAITSYDKAIEIKPDFYAAWSNRGTSLNNLGQHELAIASYDKAIKIKPDFYVAWSNRGKSLADLEQYELAIASYDKAIEIKSDFHQAWEGRATTYCYLTKKRDFQRSLIVAIQSSNQIVRDHIFALQEAIPHLSPKTYGYADLFSSLGRAYYDHSDSQRNPSLYWRNAVRSYTTALRIFTADLYPKERLEALQGVLFPLLRLRRIVASQTYRREGLEILRQLLNAQPTSSQKRRLEGEFSSFSRVAVDSLVTQNEIIFALETAERYKNRCLTWILDEWKEQVISPSYAEILQLLDPQTAIVYWHFSDESLTTFMLTPTSEDPIVLENPLPYDRSQKLQSWIKSWDTQYNDYRTKKANQSDHPWRKTLSAQLNKLKELLQIQTIESHLSNIQNLILLPHRDLHRFPLHALFSESLTISYLPSIQIGLNLKSRSSDRTSCLLNVEDPDRGNSMPFAQLESVILKAMFAPNAVSIPPEKSDRTTVESALKTHHGIFHFTGHANYNDRKPEDSELALKNSDTLTAKEISSLDLKNYHLVSLSACETALNGTQSIDTEYVGLTSAFLQAGVPYVISTLWTVEEASNAYLMIRFYQFWQSGQESAIALRSAQNWLRTCSNATLAQWLKDLLPHTESDPGAQEYLRSCIQSIEGRIDETEPPYRDPYYWAAFTHTGL